MNVLNVTFKPSSSLLPSSHSSLCTPSLTPTASSTSTCTVSSTSLSTCPTRLDRPVNRESDDGHDGERGNPPPGYTSRPSLRHMPSWRSFTSHMSRNRSGESESGEEYSSGCIPLDTSTPDKNWKTQKSSRRETLKNSLKLTKALKKLSMGHLARHDLESGPQGRPPVEDDPGDLSMVTPRRGSDQSTLSLVECSSCHSDGDEDELEYFTPPSIPTSVLKSFKVLPRHTFPRVGVRNAPTPVSTPCEIPRPAIPDQAPRSDEDLQQDTRGDAPFDIDIFSPRVRQTPVLRGIIYNLPISPLELPSSQTSRHGTFPSKSPASRQTLTLPLLSPSFNTMPSLSQVLSEINPPRDTIQPLHPSTSQTLSRPRSSLPTSSSTPDPFTAKSPYPKRYSTIRLMPILPCPTPPSLILSPRSLGTPIIPPGPTSPSRLDSLGKPPESYTDPDSFPYRVKRTSSIIRTNGLGPISPPAGLGLGMMSPAGLKKRQDGVWGGPNPVIGEKRLPTPGTFGLQGEAEKRLVLEGVNPYFA